MKLLAIDTSGEACSAALMVNGDVRQRLALEPRRHGDLLLGMMEALLADAGLGLSDLDALAFGRGPGSFTGVRIGTCVAQGAALGADLPVVPVSTLAALAQGHHRARGVDRSLAAFDARMGELYWGCYRIGTDGLMALVGEEEVAPPGGVRIPDTECWHGVGSGWAAHGELLRERLAGRLESVTPDAICEARDITALAAAALAAGQFVAPEHALPVYLRDEVTSRS